MICIIGFCWSYKLSNTKSMYLNGGSYLAMYGNNRVLDIYNTRPSTDPIFKVFEKLDYDIFKKQIEAVNKYCKNGDSTLKIFIVPDIHGSLIEAFSPLIHANIIKENSLYFDNNKFIFEIHNSINNGNKNKIIYCGDIIARGANRYNVQLLDCILTLVNSYPEHIKLVLGNHETSFINPLDMPVWNNHILNDYKNTSSEEYINTVRKKLVNYFMNNINALVYKDSFNNMDFIVTHTIIYDCGDIRYINNGKTTIKAGVQNFKTNGVYDNGSLHIENLYNFLCNTLNNAVINNNIECWNNYKYYTDIIYTNSRPKKFYDKKWKLDLFYPLINFGSDAPLHWFVGHQQVQEVNAIDRLITHKNLFIHFLDVNTNNNLPSDKVYLQPYEERKYVNYYGLEHLYYYDLVNNKYVDKFIDNKINDIIIEYYKYIG